MFWGKARMNRRAAAGLVVTIYSQQSKSSSRRRTEKPHGSSMARMEKVVVMMFHQFVNDDALANTKHSKSRSRKNSYKGSRQWIFETILNWQFKSQLPSVYIGRNI